MRHIFVLNPVAGKVRAAMRLPERIKACFAALPEEEFSICQTTGPKDATRIAAEACAEAERTGVPVRLYACGGDGTLQEVADGIPHGSGAELTVIPCGSGNDYVRLFGGREPFWTLEDLVRGSSIPVDAVDCDGRRSLNIASIGMDAKVCAKMIRYKNLPGGGGSMAYELAIADVFCHPIGDDMVITVEGEQGRVERSGKFLMALAANGQYYGGGYHGAPQAVINDGVLDFVLVRKISRAGIPGFLKKYKAGDYADLPFCEHLRGSSMTVTSARPTWCNVDGECTLADRMHFAVLPREYRFVLPAAVFTHWQEEKKTAAAL